MILKGIRSAGVGHRIKSAAVDQNGLHYFYLYVVVGSRVGVACSASAANLALSLADKLIAAYAVLVFSLALLKILLDRTSVV